MFSLILSALHTQPMTMATEIYYQDDDGKYERQYGQLQGLLMVVRNASKPALQLRSGVEKRTQLDIGDTPVLWAQTCDSLTGVEVWRSLLRTHDLLPPIDSSTIQHVIKNPAERIKREWLIYFAQSLRDSSCLYDGLWALQYRDSSSFWFPRWGNRKKEEHWRSAATPQELALLEAKKLSLDWSVNGSSQIVNLYSPQQANAGRLKWWRKVAREGNLPPILLLEISGLCAYVILDGHLRLQACLLERQAPQFVVLAAYFETDGPEASERGPQLAAQMENLAQLMQQSDQFNPENFALLQRQLAAFYDTRPKRYFASKAKANLDVAQWDHEVGLIEQEDSECIYLNGI